MEWLVALAATGACVWVTGLVLGMEIGEPDRCRFCGAPLVLADESFELVRQGLSNQLWASCTACGGSTNLSLGLGEGPEWLR
jgi:hypothetical protein